MMVSVYHRFPTAGHLASVSSLMLDMLLSVGVAVFARFGKTIDALRAAPSPVEQSFSHQTSPLFFPLFLLPGLGARLQP